MQPGLVIAAGARPAWLGAVAGAIAAWIAAERGRFALWLPVFMVAGVVGYFALTFEPPWWVGPAWFAAALALGWLAGTRPPLRAPCWAVAAAALGVASAQVATLRAPAVVDIPRRATIVTGTVRAVEQLPQGRRITLEQPRFDEAAPAPRAVRLRLRAGDEVAVATGDTLRVRALLMHPAPPAYPGAWDLQRDAFYSGMGGYGYALNPAARTAEALPSGPARWLQWLREAIAARIAATLPGTEGAIAATLLTGATASIPEADRAAFRNSGLAHLLAIAGLHIGIVMGLFFAATRLVLALSEYAALYWRTKEIAALTALAAGGGYMLLTGAHVPIIRSFAMACLVTLGVIVGRRALSLRGLALAMTALILLAPSEVMGVSFQMSFSAVLALIVGYEAMQPWLLRLHGDGSWRRRFLGVVAALALTSALAGTFSAPYGAYHFGRVQIYYVIANVVAVPLTALWVMPAGLIALALMPLHAEALALVPMGWGVDAVPRVGRTVSSWPEAVVAVPHMPAWGLVALSLGIAWAGLWRTRVRLAGAAAITLGLVSPAFDRPPDLLVSADARLIAVRTADGVFMQKTSGASRFTLDSWLQLWAAGAASPLPASGEAAGGAVSCTAAACTLRPRGAAALLLRAAPDEAACSAPLLVSAEPIRLVCTHKVEKIDRFSVWHDGAYAAWLDPAGVRVLSDRQDRGDRPWVPPDPSRGRMPPGLTPAQTEELPAE
jgi:competence protein ComEC